MGRESCISIESGERLPLEWDTDLHEECFMGLGTDATGDDDWVGSGRSAAGG